MGYHYKYFSDKELRCKCCGQIHMDDEFMTRLIGLRETCDFPFNVTSAYRCPNYNNSVSRSGFDGPHTTGKAVDIALHGKEAYQLISLASKYGITGIGVSQSGPVHSRFIHLDMCDNTINRPRPWVWSY